VSHLGAPLLARWTKARRAALAWDWLARLDVTALVTHRIAFADASRAYHLLDDPPAEALQIVLRYRPSSAALS
jgi:hypothetical protein